MICMGRPCLWGGEHGRPGGGRGTYVCGAARKPEAACWPAAGWIAGRGPKRGLNGEPGFCCVGFCGFVDATNCGVVRFRHDVNSTVEPRYCEQLGRSQVRKRSQPRRSSRRTDHPVSSLT